MISSIDSGDFMSSSGDVVAAATSRVAIIANASVPLLSITAVVTPDGLRLAIAMNASSPVGGMSIFGGACIDSVCAKQCICFRNTKNHLMIVSYFVNICFCVENEPMTTASIFSMSDDEDGNGSVPRRRNCK